MNAYEKLCQEADENGITIEESYEFKSDRIKGLYCDDVIALNKHMKSTSERACILAEELGHYHKTVGNIIDLQDTQNLKRERIARIWSYDKMIGLSGIVSAYERHCANRYEMAEYLDVTEEMLQDALDYYSQKYADGASYGQYVIQFIPTLRVAKIY